MKIKYLLPGLMLSASLLVSCGDEKTEKTESEKKEVKAADEIIEEEVVLDEVSDDFGLNSQWEDIVLQIKNNDKKNLNMYLRKSSEKFSQEEWDALDFSQPEFYDMLSAFENYKDLPLAEYVGEGVRMVQVYFETEQDGQVFESTAIIYLVEEDGLIWIIGSELIG